MQSPQPMHFSPSIFTETISTPTFQCFSNNLANFLNLWIKSLILAEQIQINMKKILVAVDESNYSKKAVEEAVRLGQELGAELTFLNVVPTYGYAGEVLDEALEEKISSAQELVEGYKEEAEEENVQAESKVTKESAAANGIVQYAKNHEFDLIIIGARGKSGLETIQLGSVSEAVVKRSETPVLVYR